MYGAEEKIMIGWGTGRVIQYTKKWRIG